MAINLFVKVINIIRIHIENIKYKIKNRDEITYTIKSSKENKLVFSNQSFGSVFRVENRRDIGS